MAEIINLRRARKAKDKAAKESQAAENRIRFGRTRAERDVMEAEGKAAVRHIEGHRLKGEPPEE